MLGSLASFLVDEVQQAHTWPERQAGNAFGMLGKLTFLLNLNRHFKGSLYLKYVPPPVVFILLVIWQQFLDRTS